MEGQKHKEKKYFNDQSQKEQKTVGTQKEKMDINNGMNILM